MKKVFTVFLVMFFVVSSSGASAKPGSDLLSRIKEAQEVLSKSNMSAGCGAKSHVCRSGKDFEKSNVILAVSCSSPRIHQVRLLSDRNKSGKYLFERGDANGVNTTFTVMKPKGCMVLAQKRPVSLSNGRFSEVVYTAYSSAIDTPEIRQQGMRYLVKTIDNAHEALYKKGVISRPYHRRLVAGTVPPWVAVRLALVEHIDPARLQNESMRQLVNEVQVVIGVNGANAYRYSVSDAGARGILQITPHTYELIRSSYTTARLKKDFIEGTRDPVNAAQATVLLFDLDTETLSREKRLILLHDGLRRMEYLAAAYNGGSGRAEKAMRADGSLALAELPLETQGYIYKLRGVHDVLR